MRTWVIERQWVVDAETAFQAIGRARHAHDFCRVFEKVDAPAVADEIRRLLDRLEPLGWGPEVTELMALTRKLVHE